MSKLNDIIDSIPEKEFLKLFDSHPSEAITVLVSNDLTLINVKQDDIPEERCTFLTLTPITAKGSKPGFIVRATDKIGNLCASEYAVLFEKVRADGERELFLEQVTAPFPASRHVYKKAKTSFLLPTALVQISPGKIVTIAKEENVDDVDRIEVFTDRDEAIKEIERFTFNCDGVSLETKVASVPCHLVQKIDERYFVTPVTFSLTVK